MKVLLIEQVALINYSIWLLEAPKIQKGQGIASNPSNNSISRPAGLALVKTVKPLDEANLVSAEMRDK